MKEAHPGIAVMEQSAKYQIEPSTKYRSEKHCLIAFRLFEIPCSIFRCQVWKRLNPTQAAPQVRQTSTEPTISETSTRGSGAASSQFFLLV